MVSEDPVLRRRARVAKLVRVAQRAGYGCLLAAIVVFGIAAATSFPHWAVTMCVVALIAATVILPVPIVLGYGVRAAQRDEDRAARGLPPRSH
jgi:ABC-type proline/glycine betaine transport system permease subunit